MSEMTWPSPLQNPQFRDFTPMVLLVDDEPVIRELYRVTLDGQPFRVLTAADGQQALALAQACIPELLVTDVAMPRLDGFGLIQALRRLYPDLPVIIATGNLEYRGRPVEEVAAEHGAVAIFMKPFDLSQLQETIGRALPFRGSAPLTAATDGVRVA
jgi:CheY-like chemotaxis protein